MKTNKKILKAIISLCIIAILIVVAIPGCSLPSSILCTLIACVMAHYMNQLDILNSIKKNINQ